MINKLVFENLRHRWVRTLLSALVIGVQVMSILTLIGLSDGLLQDSATRQKGTGADIVLKPESGPATFSFGSGQQSEKIVSLVAQQPHVASAIGVLGVPVELITTVQGVDIQKLKAMSGGIPMISGRLPSAPDDLLIDQFYADENHLEPGHTWKLLNHQFTVSGIMQGGLLGHLIVLLPTLQRLTSQTGKVSQILVKLDNPALTNQELKALNQLLKGDMRAYSMEAILSNFNINNIPQLKIFIRVIEGLAILVGFLVVFLSMYTAVIERMREIGILKALGAKPATILDLLVRESLFLALLGSILGIIFAIGAKWLLPALMPSLVIVNVPSWWPVAAAIAIGGALLGASYPGMKAARQDAIEALSYD